MARPEQVSVRIQPGQPEWRSKLGIPYTKPLKHATTRGAAKRCVTAATSPIPAPHGTARVSDETAPMAPPTAVTAEVSAKSRPNGTQRDRARKRRNGRRIRFLDTRRSSMPTDVLLTGEEPRQRGLAEAKRRRESPYDREVTASAVCRPNPVSLAESL